MHKKISFATQRDSQVDVGKIVWMSGFLLVTVR